MTDYNKLMSELDGCYAGAPEPEQQSIADQVIQHAREFWAVRNTGWITATDAISGQEEYLISSKAAKTALNPPTIEDIVLPRKARKLAGSYDQKMPSPEFWYGRMVDLANQYVPSGAVYLPNVENALPEFPARALAVSHDELPARLGGEFGGFV